MMDNGDVCSQFSSLKGDGRENQALIREGLGIVQVFPVMETPRVKLMNKGAVRLARSPHAGHLSPLNGRDSEMPCGKSSCRTGRWKKHSLPGIATYSGSVGSSGQSSHMLHAE